MCACPRVRIFSQSVSQAAPSALVTSTITSCPNFFILGFILGRLIAGCSRSSFGATPQPPAAVVWQRHLQEGVAGTMSCKSLLDRAKTLPKPKERAKSKANMPTADCERQSSATGKLLARRRGSCVAKEGGSSLFGPEKSRLRAMTGKSRASRKFPTDEEPSDEPKKARHGKRGYEEIRSEASSARLP